MAVNPLTPGVYIDEISVFPPSVAPVATAVPAFIGYTKSGTPLVPTRITSMLEYEQIFGGAFSEALTATVAGPSVTVAATTSFSEYTMHYNLRMYFANGGGPCYIVSVGDYTETISHTALIDGVNITEKADEVTLLVVPDAMASTVNASQRAAIHSAQLDLCNKMKDRFSIMDVLIANPSQSIFDDAADFRNDEVGNNNLKYGAAYYPALNTSLTLSYIDSNVTIDGGIFDTLTLADVKNGVKSTATVLLGTVVNGDSINVAGVDFQAGPAASTLNTDNPFIFLNTGSALAKATALKNAINFQAVSSLVVTASLSTNDVVITANSSGLNGDSIVADDANGGGNLNITTSNPSGTDLGGGINADISLYNSITAKILSENTVQLYPSSTMAGIYASVDRDRGVWKAPANVSLTGVVSPSVNISAAEQENLNVDATSGKSINAIRAFAGKGILVWGGRTLAGNDNEWSYINVRRLFIFAEESIQKASEFVVFEPNDANTWSRVRSLISSFLTNLWRDGALAGATPAQAFFVRVGLGETMTAQDILEGKMIIEVGLAAVRPAEFIVLKFSHKLQEA